MYKQENMNIALIGYGKMGKAIEKIAIERGHNIVVKIDTSSDLHLLNTNEIDIAIEFTQPNAVLNNIQFCFENQIPVVVGTTGWHNELYKVKNWVLEHNASLLYASNFSVGVNIFFEINKKLAQIMSKHSEYTASIEEIHHVQKLDAPSGTAVSLANDLISKHSKYKNWQLGEGEYPMVSSSELADISYREPDVPGTHIVRYESEIDTIEILHEANNRKGFALGAVLAAEFLKEKKGIFTMSDVLQIS